MGLEKEGYTRGAIYVLHLENVGDWTQAILQPRPSSASKKTKKGRAAAANPFARASLRAEFKGYGRWRVRAHIAVKSHVYSSVNQRKQRSRCIEWIARVLEESQGESHLVW